MKASKSEIENEIKLILETLAQFKDGASIETIKQSIGKTVEHRTLQRRLDTLKSQGMVTTSGKARNTIYHLLPIPITATNPNTTPEATEIVPLSIKSRKLLEIISKPSALRKPVGYNVNFLRKYRPNVDSYLTNAEKQKLAELGITARLEEAAGTYAKEILQRLLIDLSWNSSRLEGNTYSLLDTQRLISQGKAADDKSAADAQMILNHKEAIEFIVQGSDEIGFNRYTITNLHGLLSNNLLPDPAASGRLRSMGVGITNSVFIPLGIPQQIEEMFEVFLTRASEITNPFEQALFVMIQLPYLQPFDDVNKRVSRLAANIPLNRHNLAPLAFVDVPNDIYLKATLSVYELNRTELIKDVFLWAYERSSLRYAALRQSLGEPDTFRMKYREDIRILITDIVTNALPQHEAVKKIQSKARFLPQGDQAKFIETVDTELLSLHEGNIARYRIRPSQFAQWKASWQ